MVSRIEFYQFNNEVWYRQGKENKKLTEDSPIVSELISYLCEFYPQAVAALEKEYKNIADDTYRRYRIVVRFCKCNFGIADNVFDIDSESRFVFECVACPLRGECKLENIVCNPTFNSSISKSEMRVLELLYRGVARTDIADRLYLSERTVHNHIRNAFCRIGVHSTIEFIEYANSNKLFAPERFDDEGM